MPHGFSMGDHQFYSLDESGPVVRYRRSTGPIIPAVAPAYLGRFATCYSPDSQSSAARSLAGGGFCGHGEPTFGVFMLAVPPSHGLCLRWHAEGPASCQSVGRITVAAEPDAERWLVLYDRDWIKLGIPADELPREPIEIAQSSDELLRGDDGTVLRLDVAIGFEYPAQCIGPSDVSWLAIAVASLSDGVARTILSEELA